MPPQLTVQVV